MLFFLDITDLVKPSLNTLNYWTHFRFFSITRLELMNSAMMGKILSDNHINLFVISISRYSHSFDCSIYVQFPFHLKFWESFWLNFTSSALPFYFMIYWFTDLHFTSNCKSFPLLNLICFSFKTLHNWICAALNLGVSNASSLTVMIPDVLCIQPRHPVIASNTGNKSLLLLKNWPNSSGLKIYQICF